MKEENNEVKTKNEEMMSKIAITKEADRALIEMYNRISEGFDSGRVTKQDVASQMILRFALACKESDIQDLRKKFFDPILAIEAKLRKAKETGFLSEALKEILYDEFMTQHPQSSAKRSKKTLPADIITDKVGLNQEIT